MRRYTTPTLPMTVPVDLTGAEIHVTIKQGARKLEKDTGDTSVEYRADIQRYIDKRLLK